MANGQAKPNYHSDQDISQIVDQVLSCIDTSQFDLDYNQEPEGSTLLLCHNCGARLKFKVPNCKSCGAEISNLEHNEPVNNNNDLKR